MLDYISLATIALALDIVGVIFLGNSMGVRRPRRFLQEYFGIQRQQHLRAVLDQLRAKAEIFTGFLFLLFGFSLQIVAALSASPPLPPADADATRLQAGAFALLAGAVLLATILLRAGCRAWSLSLFRRLLAEFFSEHPDWNFEKHAAEVREMGEILSVPALPDDSISDYVQRVRTALLLPPQQPVPHTRDRDDAFGPVRRVGADRRL